MRQQTVVVLSVNSTMNRCETVTMRAHWRRKKKTWTFKICSIV